MFSRPYVSSTKGNVGHLLGAAGAFEAAMCIKALSTNTIPPTILRGGEIDTKIPVNVVSINNTTGSIQYHFNNLSINQQQGQEHEIQNEQQQQQQQEESTIDVALSNSFGFGGTNATLVFAKFDPTQYQQCPGKM
eukprot:UN00416